MFLYQKAKSEAEKLVNGKVDIPPQGINADFAFPCFHLARQQKKNPNEIAKELTGKIKPTKTFEKVEAAGPYVNFTLSDEFVAQSLAEIIAKKDNFGKQKVGKNRKIVVEYSSPNIAKPMHMGHLSTTLIGDSLYRILSILDYKCIRMNHIGDWGTQFGKLLYAYKNWGSKKSVEKGGIEELMKLYVKFHAEAANNPALDDYGRKEFNKLEKGDKENKALWQWFVEVSLKDFMKIYKRLGVEFDFYLGESFYEKMNRKIIEDAKSKGIAQIDKDKSIIIPINDRTPPALIQKSDGATLYITRDIASLKYRMGKFRPEKMIYVVGSEQKLHFEQLFAIAEKMYNYPKTKFEHVENGQIRLPEGKISTRLGRVIFLEDVLDKAVELALQTIKQKNPKLKNADKVAEQIGIGAIKFANLSQNRIKEVVFEWDKMLDFNGDTGPYLQYTHARACAILREAGSKSGKTKNKLSLSETEETNLAKKLSQFPNAILKSAENYEPHKIATYLLEVAHTFNAFYQKHRVLGSENEPSRLALVNATRIVLANGLQLLGIKALEEM